MNFLRHTLTEEEKEYVNSCLEFINSNDDETVKLGISLFYENFGDYRFPIDFNGQTHLVKLRPSRGLLCKSIIKFLFKNGYCYY